MRRKKINFCIVLDFCFGVAMLLKMIMKINITKRLFYSWQPFKGIWIEHKVYVNIIIGAPEIGL